MATEQECPFYNSCGFVTYRKKHPSNITPPLPTNGDCGVAIALCDRNGYARTLKPDIRNILNNQCRVQDILTHTLPIFAREIDIVFPPSETSEDGKTSKRLPGGGFGS